jgi:hypothetical protein
VPISAQLSDREKRNDQLAKLAKADDPFSGLDTAWFNMKTENLERLIAPYNLANTKGREK